MVKVDPPKSIYLINPKNKITCLITDLITDLTMPRGRGKRQAPGSDLNTRSAKKQKLNNENLFDQVGDEILQSIISLLNYRELGM